MATLSAVILKDKVLKNGRHKIRISLAHNGKTRFITTDIVIDNASQFKNGQIVKRPDAAILNTKLRGLMQFYQSGIDKVHYASCLTCTELISVMMRNTRDSHRSLDSVFKECLDCSRIKEKTRELNLLAWKKITQYIDKDSLVETLTPTALCKLENNLLKTLSQSSVAAYMNVLRKVVNFAIRNNYTDAANPFSMYKTPTISIRDCWLSVDEIRLIRDAKIKTKGKRFARDIFMLSYYLGGINFVDMANLNFKQCQHTIKYERQKTEHMQKINKYVEFDIPDEAKEIIKNLIGSDGRLKTRNPKFLSAVVNSALHALTADLGITKRVIYYSARKSFSQHAFELGVRTDVIDYILGHSLGSSSGRRNSSLFNYISVTPEMATEAVRLVIDNLAKSSDE